MSKAAALPLTHAGIFADRRRDPGRKREAALQTAARLFLERSYDRTSMDDVAAELHITKPALYHYFTNKEEILLECFRLGVAHIEQSLSEIAHREGKGIEKVAAFIAAYAMVITQDFAKCVVRLEDRELSAARRREVRTSKRRIDERLRSLIEQGIKDHSIAPCDAKIAAFVIAGAVNWICTWYKPSGKSSAAVIAAQFARLLTRGLKPDLGRDPAGSAARSLIAASAAGDTAAVSSSRLSPSSASSEARSGPRAGAQSGATPSKGRTSPPARKKTARSPA